MNTSERAMSDLNIYLGDSVYARFDNVVEGDVWLTTRNGVPTDPTNAIYLEPEVYAALVKLYESKNGGRDGSR